MPFFVVEFRPLQYLLFVLVVGVLRGAANGDWQALVILSVCAVLLWWREMLDAVRVCGRGCIRSAFGPGGRGAG